MTTTAENTPESPQSSPTHDAPRVSIILLTFNAAESVRACVASLLQHTTVAYELIVVDNGSEAETVSYVETLRSLPGTKVHLNDNNLGYAAGNNVGLGLATAPFVLFLNSDVVLTSNWLSNMMTAIESAADIAMVGPRSNHASGSQGGVFLDDLSAVGIERFTRTFNTSDPRRWFDAASLSGYVLLARRNALDSVGSFDEKFEVGTSEDRDLCDRMTSQGHRLVVSGDTFVFHEGHRSFIDNSINFVQQNILNARLLNDEKPPELTSSECLNRVTEGSIVSFGTKHKYLHRDGLFCPLATSEAMLLLREPGSDIVELGRGDLPSDRVGPPVFFVRSETPEVYLLIAGSKHLLVGDQQRVRRIRGITVVRCEELEQFTSLEALDVDGRLPPIDKQKPILSTNPITQFEDSFLSTDDVAERIQQAFEGGHGLSMVRLGSGEAIVLNQGIYPIRAFNTDYSGVPLPNEIFRHDLIAAIRDADIVGLSPNRELDYCAPLLEKLLDHFSLYPQTICSAFVNWELMGIDRDTGCPEEDGPLVEVLKSVRVALVGRMAESAAPACREAGFNVTVHCGLDGEQDIETAFAHLQMHVDKFDVLLAAAGIPAVVLCTRVAKELNRVALDFGHVLNRYISSSFNEETLIREKLLWRATKYIESWSGTQLPQASLCALDGKFVIADQRSHYYIERGTRRYVSNPAVPKFFGAEPHPVATDEVDSLPIGLPMMIFHGHLTGTFFLKDGRRFPVSLGCELLSVPDTLLETLEGAMPINTFGVWAPRVAKASAPKHRRAISFARRAAARVLRAAKRQR